MLAIQLAFLTAGLVWGTVLCLRGSLIVGCMAWLLAVVCFGRSFMSAQVGPVTVSIDRVALVLLVAVYVVHRCLGKTDPKPFALADYLLFAFLGWLTFSTLTHDFRRSFFETRSSPLWNLLAGYWMPVTVYWIARQSKLDQRAVNQLYGFLVLLGCYLAVTGILEITGQWWAVFPRYIADPDLGIHFGRARGPFGNSVRYGVYVSVCFFAGFLLWCRLPQKWQMLSLPLSLLFLAAVFFSYTRSVWLGLAAGVAVVAMLCLPRRIRNTLVISTAAVVLCVGCLHWEKLVFLEREESGGNAAVSVSNRASHAYVSWNMFQDRPLVGWGYGQYPNEKLAYLYDRNTTLKLERLRTRLSHNTVLTLLVEVGVIGLGLFLAVLAAWIFNAIRLWRNPNSAEFARSHAILFLAALCVYGFQLLFHEITFRPDINALIFLLAGTVTGLRLQTDARSANAGNWLPTSNIPPIYPALP